VRPAVEGKSRIFVGEFPTICDSPCQGLPPQLLLSHPCEGYE